MFHVLQLGLHSSVLALYGNNFFFLGLTAQIKSSHCNQSIAIDAVCIFFLLLFATILVLTAEFYNASKERLKDSKCMG